MPLFPRRLLIPLAAALGLAGHGLSAPFFEETPLFVSGQGGYNT